MRKNNQVNMKLIVSLMVLFLMFLFTPPGIAGQNSPEESRLAGTKWDVHMWNSLEGWEVGTVEFMADGTWIAIRAEGEEGLLMRYEETNGTGNTVNFIMWHGDPYTKQLYLIGRGTAELDTFIRMRIRRWLDREYILPELIYGVPFAEE